MLVARRYLIRGLVQGVGFRLFTEDVAHLEGVRGCVRNLGDGRVEAVVEGDLEAVERFEMAMRRGPRGARVDEVEVEALPPSGRHTGFRITI